MNIDNKQRYVWRWLQKEKCNEDSTTIVRGEFCVLVSKKGNVINVDGVVGGGWKTTSDHGATNVKTNNMDLITRLNLINKDKMSNKKTLQKSSVIGLYMH